MNRKVRKANTTAVGMMSVILCNSRYSRRRSYLPLCANSNEGEWAVECDGGRSF